MVEVAALFFTGMFAFLFGATLSYYSWKEKIAELEADRDYWKTRYTALVETL